MDAPLPSTDRLERIEMLTVADEYAAAPAQVVQAAGLGCEWIGGALVVWASRSDVLMFNRAIGLGQAVPAAAEQIASIAARFDREGVPRSFMQIAPGALPDGLAGRLAPHGYAPYNRWVKFARPLTALPPLSADVRIDLIDPDRAAEFARVFVAAFRMPPHMQDWEAAVVGRPGWRHYLAHHDGEVVGCASSFVAEGLAALGHAGTLESARGRGVQGAMIARRLADAAAAGCTHAVLETAEDRPEKPAPSFRNQLRHGFTLCYYRDNFLRARPGTPRPDPAPAT